MLAELDRDQAHSPQLSATERQHDAGAQLLAVGPRSASSTARGDAVRGQPSTQSPPSKQRTAKVLHTVEQDPRRPVGARGGERGFVRCSSEPGAVERVAHRPGSARSEAQVVGVRREGRRGGGLELVSASSRSARRARATPAVARAPSRADAARTTAA